MAYDKHIFNKGDKLTAAQLNTMNDEIEKLDEYKAESSDVPSALSQLTDDSTHRLVTDTEKATWNAKQNAISDIATIRSNATKAGNMEIGGRNYLRNTGDLAKWTRNTTNVPDSGISGNVATISHTDSQSWNYSIQEAPRTHYADIKNQIVTISFYCKRNGESNTGSVIASLARSYSNEGERIGFLRIIDEDITNVSTNEWTKIIYTSPIITNSFFGWTTSTIPDDGYVYLQLFNYSLDTIQIKDIKLEVGNMATDWTAAPEDADSTYDIVTKIINDIYTSSSVSVYQTVTGWTLISESGLCKEDSTRQFIKFACSAGNLYKISGARFWQFQSSQHVPSSGSSNRIGVTHDEDGYFVAPTNATYIICDCSTSSTVACYLMSK